MKIKMVLIMTITQPHTHTHTQTERHAITHTHPYRTCSECEAHKNSLPRAKYKRLRQQTCVQQFRSSACSSDVVAQPKTKTNQVLSEPC